MTGAFGGLASIASFLRDGVRAWLPLRTINPWLEALGKRFPTRLKFRGRFRGHDFADRGVGSNPFIAMSKVVFLRDAVS